MCRLLGLIANMPVDLEFSLLRFKEYSARNPDGWGIGWYENGSARVFKQGISVGSEESQLSALSKRVRSRIIIAHVRKGTGAEPSELNSHPFRYKNWLFAHNGSVDRDYLLSLLRKEYIAHLTGNTDSEVYFYWILQCAEETGGVVKGIRKALGEVMSRGYTGLNFLLSDGSCLYSFRYSRCSQDYYSLWLLKRDPSELPQREFISKETGALMYSKRLGGERAVLVCSERLTTEEEWEEIKFGDMVVIKPDLNTETELLLSGASRPD